MNLVRRTAMAAALALVVALSLAGAAAAAPLRIGYSDWPGWVAWQVAIDKGWLRAAGLDVTFDWFDYSASMEAFARAARAT
jgi:NitT/TauT family transport system substrate-binding protein